MKINEIIRSKRAEKNMTQEDVAKALGVSTAAVSKWESARSIPDITILPPLARLLETDLNTLLSFKEDLSDQEVANFINHLSEILLKEGWERAEKTASAKAKEFPSSDVLLVMIASFLQSALAMFPENDTPEIRRKIEGYFLKVQKNGTGANAQMATQSLFHHYLNNDEFEKAEEELELLPQKNVDVRKLKALLVLRKGDTLETYKTAERQIVQSINDIMQALGILVSNALKDVRPDLAEYYKDVAVKGADLFELWDLNQYSLELEIASKARDKERTISAVRGSLEAGRKDWKLAETTLYQHIGENQSAGKFNDVMKQNILKAFQMDEALDFVRDEPEFIALAEEYGG